MNWLDDSENNEDPRDDDDRDDGDDDDMDGAEVFQDEILLWSLRQRYRYTIMRRVFSI